ncbi:hypothetical protein J6590_076095 [Homalodisca vitripennis]|nr:hypothetical protein J6590_076095 [Homalodisca vitripennis]
MVFLKRTNLFEKLSSSQSRYRSVDLGFGIVFDLLVGSSVALTMSTRALVHTSTLGIPSLGSPELV